MAKKTNAEKLINKFAQTIGDALNETHELKNLISTKKSKRKKKKK